jgi:hypothetical protein
VDLREISTLLTVGDQDFYAYVYGNIQANFLYEREPDSAEKEKQAEGWLNALWTRHKEDICKLI